MNSTARSKYQVSSGLFAALAAISLSAGCHISPNPWKDHFANQDAVTTASAEGVRSAASAPIRPAREYDKSIVAVPDGAVDHLPLYFRDYCVDDRPYAEFSWRYRDYARMIGEPVRFHLDVVLSPVRGIITPIWTVVTSDGVKSPSWIRGSTDPVLHGKG